MSSASNDQKTPFVKSLNLFADRRLSSYDKLKGQAIPATIVEISANKTIATVKFELIDDVLQLPEIEVPIATDKYARAPLKKGDKGYCVPADYYMGGVSGLGGGMASFSQMPNLSTLVFHPIGNEELGEVFDEDKYEIATDKGAIFKVDDEVIVDIGPTEGGGGGNKNVIRMPTLVAATNDADAKAKGVPLMGLYQTSGAVKVRIT